jgi:O-antigen/teichoic acid export membrane protein
VFVWVAPFIFNIMVNIKFHEAYPIVPIVALGLTFESVRKLFIGYHYNLGKNYRIAFITISAGILNAIMNYILIPKYGIDGAAYATLIAYTIVAIITIIDVNKFEKIPWLLKMEVK